MNDLSNLETSFNLICQFFKQDPEVVKSKSRKTEHKTVRFWFYWISRKYYKGQHYVSLQALGAYTGGRDHATVLHGLKKVEEWIETEESSRKISRQLMYEMDELTGDMSFRADIAAGRYTESVQKEFSDFRDTLLILRNHVINDSTCEGWRKEKKLDLIRKLDARLKSIEGFPLMYDQVKKNIQSDMYEG